MTKVTIDLPDVPEEYRDRLVGECEFRCPVEGDCIWSDCGQWIIAAGVWKVRRLCYRLKPKVKYITPDNAYALAHPQCECEVLRPSTMKWEPGHKLLAVVDGCSFPFCMLTPDGVAGWWSKCRVAVN